MEGRKASNAEIVVILGFGQYAIGGRIERRATLVGAIRLVRQEFPNPGP